MFIRDQEGTIAVSSAVAGLVLIGAVGVAYDVSQLVASQQRLQSIADSAALAAMGPEKARDSVRVEIANGAIDNYLLQTGNPIVVNDRDVAVGSSDLTVTISSEQSLVFGGIVGQGQRAVSASATAKEYTGEANAGVFGTMSMSFVIDLSESMNDMMGRQSRIDAVRSTLTEVLGVPGTPVETAVYPYEWGMVDTSVSPLQPGITAMMQELHYVNTDEGSVPSEALETAVAEQQADQASDPAAQRYVIFIADGEADADKGDAQGVYLDDRNFFEAGKHMLTMD